MVRINGDLIPSISGTTAIGVDMGITTGSIDISTLSPLSRYHTISGIYHNEFGTSGVFRYGRSFMEVSNDGGKTFNTLANTGNVVTDIGVLGDVGLVGSVDVASPASGFIVIQDTADASPLLWSVNTLALSGLWGFPATGFPLASARCFAANFTGQTSVTATHNFGTADVIVMVYDNSSPRNYIIPDSIALTSTTAISVTFNRAQDGRIIVIGCS